jgi:hypothetical protein
LDYTSIINNLESISLEEMDNVRLMNRTDTKFLCHTNILADILSLVKNEYKILTINEFNISSYKTLYFDFPDYLLYKQHHNGKLNRFKIRHRTYLESNIAFLEVKQKTNKGRTVKTRIPLEQPDWKNNEAAKTFLIKKLPFSPDSLVPALWVNYSRITLVNKHSAERITIDINLEFEKNGAKKSYPSLMIAEVKQDSKLHSEFLAVMRKLHIKEGSISKYCLGVANLINEQKKNNFKFKLLQINKLLAA